MYLGCHNGTPFFLSISKERGVLTHKRRVLQLSPFKTSAKLFGARNRTSSIIRYFTLLADIVCINPFRNKPDMTTMTNNSSKI